MVDIQFRAELDNINAEPDQVHIRRLDLAHVDDQAFDPRVHRLADFAAEMSVHIAGDGLVEGGRQGQHHHALTALEILVRGIETQRPGYLGLQVDEIDWLRDDAVEAELLGARLFLGGRLDAQSENGNALGPHAGAEHLEQNEAGVFRQGEADENDVRDGLAARIYRLPRLRGPLHGPGHALQPHLNLFDDGGLVVHDQDLQRIIKSFGPRHRFIPGFQIDDAAHAFDNQFFLEGLDEVIPHAQLGDAQHVVTARFGGEHHHGDGAQLRIGLELGQHFHAVHDWHGQIEQDDVRPLALRHGKSFHSVGGFKDLTRKPFEGTRHDHANGPAVVNGQYFRAHSE